MSRRSEKRAKRAESQWADDLRWLLDAPQGRRIVANLLARGSLDRSAFSGNSTTFYMQGRQDYVRDFVRDLRAADLAGFRRMEDEALAAEQDAARQRDEPDDPED